MQNKCYVFCILYPYFCAIVFVASGRAQTLNCVVLSGCCKKDQRDKNKYQWWYNIPLRICICICITCVLLVYYFFQNYKITGIIAGMGPRAVQNFSRILWILWAVWRATRWHHRYGPQYCAKDHLNPMDSSWDLRWDGRTPLGQTPKFEFLHSLNKVPFAYIGIAILESVYQMNQWRNWKLQRLFKTRPPGAKAKSWFFQMFSL